MESPLKIVLMVVISILSLVFIRGAFWTQRPFSMLERAGLIVVGLLLMFSAFLIATLEAHKP